MALDCRWSTDARNAAVDAKAALLNGGTLRIYAGTRAGSGITSITGGHTLLSEHTLGSPAFASASGGSAAANSIGSDEALATGTASFGQWCDDEDTVVAEGGCGTSGADINLITTDFVTGQPIDISSATLTDDATVTTT